jgi:hypothetical protein
MRTPDFAKPCAGVSSKASFLLVFGNFSLRPTGQDKSKLFGFAGLELSWHTPI